MRYLLLLSLLFATPTILVTVYTDPGQPAGTTEAALWLTPGEPATITTDPPLSGLPSVTGGACTLDGAVLTCTPDAAPLTLRLPLPLRRVFVSQGAAHGMWPGRPDPVWPETTVTIGESPHEGYRRLTIDTSGAGGVGYVVIPQDGGTSALTAYAHGSDTAVCKRLIWYDTETRDVQSVLVACGVQLDSGGSGQVVIDLPSAITYIDLAEEVSGTQRTSRWLMTSGAPMRAVLLPMVNT